MTYVLPSRKKEDKNSLICRKCGHSKSKVDGNGICIAMTKYGLCACKASKFIEQKKLTWNRYLQQKNI